MATLISILPALVVLLRTTLVVSSMNAQNWQGHHLHFAALAASWALLCGGALGAALSWKFGTPMLLIGIAGWFLFDRRNR
jgi:hypothetical protein